MCLGNLFIGKGTLSASFLSRDSVPKILSQPQIAILIEYSICIPQRKPKKAIEFLACPKCRPRPINGSGHFRELSDVTKRHLARLWNFGTLRPKINPCPMEQPQPLCALPHSCRNPKKRLSIWHVPFRDISAVCCGLRNVLNMVHIRKFTCMRRTTTRSC